MDTNEMIERYVHAVGLQLPRKLRDDIEQELRSLLYDSLEEQTLTGEEPSAKIVAELLRQFGKPAEMAVNYRPKQVLIGEVLFPIYRKIITVTLSVFGGLHLLLLLYMLATSQADAFGMSVSDVLGSFIKFGFTYTAIVTLIFAILERADNFWPELASDVAAEIEQANSAEWDPLDLPPATNTNQIDRGELLTEIVFTVLFIGSGVFTVLPADSSFIELLAPALLGQIPWLIAVWIFGVILNVIVLAQGQWTTATRWLQIGEQAVGLYVLYRIFSRPILLLDADLLPIPPSFFVAVIMAIILFSMLRNLYRLLSNQTTTPSMPFRSNTA